jgi:osmotically-inducible protein OsmY
MWHVERRSRVPDAGIDIAPLGWREQCTNSWRRQMTRNRIGVWTGAVLLVAAMSTACSDSTERTAEEAARDTGNAAERAGDAAKDAGRDVANAASDAARATGDAVLEGGRAADAAVETMDVKTALMADTRVDAGDINVDTDHTTKTVTLKGRVPTADQKAIAEQVAKSKATGYQVRNELVVGK